MSFFNETCSTKADYYPIPINSDLHFLDWIVFIWKYENAYNKLYHRPFEKILVTSWSIWTYENDEILRNSDAKTAHIVNLVVKLFGDMRYYNIPSRSFLKDYIASTHRNPSRKIQ